MPVKKHSQIPVIHLVVVEEQELVEEHSPDFQNLIFLITVEELVLVEKHLPNN